ncbi:AAA family ATPase [Pararhodospirillum photometricum]|uniref:ATPase n=1 Tax=Pararhodospirillum photometricum DSM 122 TaxID=1150469 RepID=H6SPK3_PARPM|nr:AAA family ATPase [Pararhodospirillum photometricum]CCG09528.1 ATPase [Pararhodospirillum photometricum DSM 122]
MRIDQLRLKNYRMFEEINFSFDPSFNLFIGDNGSGKTSLLEALSVAASSWFLGLRGYDSRHIQQEDVRLVACKHPGGIHFEACFPVEVIALGDVSRFPVEWSCALASRTGRATVRGAKLIKSHAFEAGNDVLAGKEIVLPVISYYGTQRLWKEPRPSQKKNIIKLPETLPQQHGLSRLEGYRDSVDPRISILQLEKWIARQSWISFQQRQDTALFVAVKQAILACLEGGQDLYFDAERGEVIVVCEESGALPLAQLSDGQRVMVALVADLAQKIARLNPHLGEAALVETPGVVLIDDLDLHLHPRWQRRVVGDLRRTFPRVQFFATAHSPQIIGEIEPRHVIALDRRSLQSSETLEHESGWILRPVMEASEPPLDLRDSLEDLERLLKAGDLVAAKECLERLRDGYGPNRP